MEVGSTRPLRDDHLTSPLPARYSPRHRGFAEGMDRHAAAVAQGRPAYPDPVTGLAVFTARFLADRGYCCDSGCRHCPYVDAPRRRTAP
jgi:hypothetical protein